MRRSGPRMTNGGHHPESRKEGKKKAAERKLAAKGKKKRVPAKPKG